MSNDDANEIARLKGELSAATWAIALVLTMFAGKSPELQRTIIRKLDSASARDLDDLGREGSERFKHRLSEHLQRNFPGISSHKSSSGGD